MPVLSLQYKGILHLFQVTHFISLNLPFTVSVMSKHSSAYHDWTLHKQPQELKQCRISADLVFLLCFVLFWNSAILKFIWKYKIVKTAIKIPNNKNTSQGITIPNFNLYYRDVAIKFVWYWHKTRYIYQWNRIKDPHRSPSSYRHLIFFLFCKYAKNIHQWIERRIFNKCLWGKGISTCRRMEFDPYLSSFSKKWYRIDQKALMIGLELWKV